MLMPPLQGVPVYGILTVPTVQSKDVNNAARHGQVWVRWMSRETDNEAGSGLIAWISAGLNVTNVFMRAAGTLARKMPPAIVRAGGHVGNAATLGAVAYEVYREES